MTTALERDIRPTPTATGEPTGANPETAYEPTDWHLAPVALVCVGVVLVLVISCFVLIAAYPTSLHDVDRTLSIAPPGPRLQTNPQRDWQTLRTEQAKRLDTYFYVDKQKGIVHIPIEQAMQKLAKTGIPGFPEPPQ